MDNEFQTTFIPKKPLAEQRTPTASSAGSKRNAKPLGIFSVVSVMLLIVAVVLAVGAFAYQRFLSTRITSLRTSLERAEKAFEPSLIVELQSLDTRLQTAESLLASHVAISPVFRLIEDATLPNVQYDSFDYSFEEGVAKVSMTGIAENYRTVAEQSLVLGENRFITDHIFSNFTLNTREQVVFDLDLVVSPELVLFEKSLGELPSQSADTSTDELFQRLNESQNMGDTETVGIPSLDPSTVLSVEGATDVDEEDTPIFESENLGESTNVPVTSSVN